MLKSLSILGNLNVLSSNNLFNSVGSTYDFESVSIPKACLNFMLFLK